jgi:hypothetical protein
MMLLLTVVLLLYWLVLRTAVDPGAMSKGLVPGDAVILLRVRGMSSPSESSRPICDTKAAA